MVIIDNGTHEIAFWVEFPLSVSLVVTPALGNSGLNIRDTHLSSSTE